MVGCEENQARFHPRFDLIILLSAPAEVLTGRLASRTTNSFGRAPGELERILDDVQAVERPGCHGHLDDTGTGVRRSYLL